jgi:hypothetical protein
VADWCWIFPQPSVERLNLVAHAYREAGVKLQLAPMMADISFFRAISGSNLRLGQALHRPHVCMGSDSI